MCQAQKIIQQILIELRLPTYSMGHELEKSMDGPWGVPYYEILFSKPSMKKRMLQIGEDIKKCNEKNKDNEEAECVQKLKAERTDFARDVIKMGLLFNWDIVDNYWDKLPGD